MKKGKAKPAGSPAPFTVAEYTFHPPCVCPACGGRMLATEYYLAVRGNVSSSQYWSKAGKVTTTTTTNYHSIRKRIGGFCPACYTKRKKPDLNFYYILVGVVGLLAIACIVLIILFVASPTFKEAAPGAGAVGLVGGLFAVYYTVKNLISALRIRSHLKQINSTDDTQLRSDNISEAFAVNVQLPLAPNEVVISSESMRSMQMLRM